MKRYANKAELIEAKAQALHRANLEHGGVFDENGNRWSDIEQERQYAATFPRWVGECYAHLDGMPKSGWIIRGFGYATA